MLDHQQPIHHSRTTCSLKPLKPCHNISNSLNTASFQLHNNHCREPSCRLTPIFAATKLLIFMPTHLAKLAQPCITGDATNWSCQKLHVDRELHYSSPPPSIHSNLQPPQDLRSQQLPWTVSISEATCLTDPSLLNLSSTLPQVKGTNALACPNQREGALLPRRNCPEEKEGKQSTLKKRERKETEKKR